MIKLEPGKATYPMPPHSRVESVDIAKRDHPDAAWTPLLQNSPEQWLSHKRWTIEEFEETAINRTGAPHACVFDKAAGAVEFYPVPDREYFVRIIYAGPLQEL